MKILSFSDNVFDVYQNEGVCFPGGNAVNVAINCAKLGYSSYYYGKIALDDYGKHLVQVLKSMNVNIDLCTYHKGSTKCCIQNRLHGERQFIKVDLKEDWPGNPLLNIDFDFDVIFTSCNSKLENEIRNIHTDGIIVYDFGEKEKYREKDYLDKIVPYIDFAQFSFSDAPMEKIQQFLNAYPFNIPVLITRSSLNPLLYYHSSYYEGIIDYIKPIDTMGAGDAFISRFVTSLVEQGWKKSKPVLSGLTSSFQLAATFSKEICQIEGGIGFPFQKKELKAILFDMDGVLVDSEKHWMKVYECFCQKYHQTFTQEDYCLLYGSSDLFQLSYMSQKFNMNPEDFKILRDDFFKGYPIDYSQYIMSDVIELLEYCKKNHIVCVIVSSSQKKEIEQMIEQCELEPYFDFIVSGWDFKNSKPDPEIYNASVVKLNIDRKHIFVIEDSIYGLQAALNAQLDVLCLKNEMNKNVEGILKFNSFKEIKNYLKIFM
ncbi:MAG: HAD-IA family hydrolase [Floccifex porci]|uniref:HAD-IA family hydrolase n=1 Tax=Floccifex porci TaxID=2606629 RepID=UPI003F10BEA2